MRGIHRWGRKAGEGQGRSRLGPQHVPERLPSPSASLLPPPPRGYTPILFHCLCYVGLRAFSPENHTCVAGLNGENRRSPVKILTLAGLQRGDSLLHLTYRLGYPDGEDGNHLGSHCQEHSSPRVVDRAAGQGAAGERQIPGALPGAMGLIGWNVHLQTTGVTGPVHTLVNQRQAGADEGAPAIKPAPAASLEGARGADSAAAGGR